MIDVVITALRPGVAERRALDVMNINKNLVIAVLMTIVTTCCSA